MVGQGEAPTGFILAVSLWLWFTVLFANFAEAMAEGCGRAQAAALRRSRRDIPAKKLVRPQYGAEFPSVSAATLRQDDVVVVEAGDFIPSDGEVIAGIASVAVLLRDNLLVYGLEGVIVPFLGIKLIDLILVLLGLV